MRALQLTGWQQPPELLDVPEPDPGPGEVIVRIGGAGACHSDLHLLHDVPPGVALFDLPFTLGHENAGWVEAMGAGVKGLEVGQPVAVFGHWGCGQCARCRQGMENYCERSGGGFTAIGGVGRDGGMAPYLLVPDPRLLLPLGELDPVDAAPLTDAGLTPYHAIKRSLHKLGPGTSVVVLGVGGLGHLAIQILTAMTACRIVAVDRREDALATALALGAETAVVAGPGARREVVEATRGRGADVVLDFVGSDETIALAVGVAAVLADVTIVGIAGGSFGFSNRVVPYEVSLATTYWGSVGELVEVLALAEAGHIRAHVERFALDDAPAAYEALHSGEICGRAVIVP